MAVTSSLTSFEDMEGTPNLVNIGTGGGPTANTDVFIEGVQSGGRRVDNTTDKGFTANVTAAHLHKKHNINNG